MKLLGPVLHFEYTFQEPLSCSVVLINRFIDSANSHESLLVVSGCSEIMFLSCTSSELAPIHIQPTTWLLPMMNSRFAITHPVPKWLASLDTNLAR